MTFTICNVCDRPGTLENSLEIKQVYSNVRKFKDQKFTVWRCSNCRSLHSKEEVDLNLYYSNYPIGQQSLDYFTRRAYHNRLRLLIKHGFKKKDKLLDFGCNKGLFLSFLKELGYTNVFGYDAYSTEYSEKKVLEQKYDVITSQDVIEHLIEPREFFDRFVGLLNKGGLFVVGTPNADRIDLSNPKLFFMQLHQPYHRHILSEQALLNLGLSKDLELLTVYKRWYNDTLFPLVNTRFSYAYGRRAGNVLDVFFEPPLVKLFLTSPLLIFYAFAGYFFPPLGNMTVFFRCN